MRVGQVIIGVLLLTRAGAALAVCGDGILDVGEECDDGNTLDGDCCSATCRFEPGGAPCPDDGNPCSADACDGAGTCQHPPGPLGIVCRPKAGECDVAETCTGLDTVCPPDTKSTAECRPAVGDCDIAESCDGVSNACPADGFAASTTVCRASAGACDVAETCPGNGPNCPADAKSTAVCRLSTGACDPAESCDGVSNDCPADAILPEGSPCDDGNACTRPDTCHSGACTGAPVVCIALDGCHVPGTCDLVTGVCSSPIKPDNAACDDDNVCTTADSCQGGVCRGLAIAGCCLVDAECADAFACTEDRCTGHACVHVPLDGRCGAPAECAGTVCAPGEVAADTSGCVVRPVDESAYCTEDDDPCTIDACHGGLCEHESDGSGPRCPMLVVPFRTALALLARARELQASLAPALAAGCSPVRGAACEVTPGQDAAQLVALLQATATDLQTAALAIAGRLAESSSPAAPRDPTVRARLAFGLLVTTPGDLRAFLGTLGQARAHRTIAAPFARGRRSEATRLLRGTLKLRGQLNRLVVRRRTFAR